MKTPISYYGGKQQLAKKIVSLIPEHKIYCEPFCGGAAILFAKEPSQSLSVSANRQNSLAKLQ
ncbi:DNA adenine methylase [Treponema phagedenis]|uniref:DNA adenine methylase n=1 Tax=Treponema phagedenis TaxID=162 RepID=UPI001981A7A0|nr:DNA adenine methylase [Treponema phagedenis]QSH99083.1 DNA adenine methylase [Treponema phagedenis]